MRSDDRAKCPYCPSRINYEKKGSRRLIGADYNSKGRLVWGMCEHEVEVANNPNRIAALDVAISQVSLSALDIQVEV